MSNYDIKTIVFDLGGVIFSSGTTLAIKKISNNFGVDYRKVYSLFIDKTNRLGYKLRAGIITMDEFLETSVKKLGLKKSDKEHIKNIWFNSYLPHYGMIDLLKKLNNGYRLVVFSGNVKDRIEFLDKRYNFMKYFDDSVFSFDFHHNKKEIEFYEELLKHLNCEPKQAILIDDDKETINFAQSVGINTITFYYPEKLFEDLKAFNVKIN